LHIGLKIQGLDGKRQRKQSRATNITDFRAFYGSDPLVLAQIWEDLQMVATEPIKAVLTQEIFEAVS
jgi:hypothetical protein